MSFEFVSENGIFTLCLFRDDSDSSEGSFTDLEERLKPIHVKRTSIRETNGVAETTVLLKEKQNDSSPRLVGFRF